jgi:diguanylate cyclase (GGDEF)-like protein
MRLATRIVDAPAVGQSHLPGAQAMGPRRRLGDRGTTSEDREVHDPLPWPGPARCAEEQGADGRNRLEPGRGDACRLPHPPSRSRRWMWCCWLWLGLGWLLAANAQVQAASAAAAPPAVVLERVAGGLSLQGRVALLADPAGQWSLADVRRTDPSAWSWPAGPLRASGPTAWWLRIAVEQTGPGGPWLLALPSTALRDVRVYGPFDADGRAVAAPRASGLIHPYASRPLGLERLVVPLELPEPGLYRVYLRVQSSIAQKMTPTLWHAVDLQLARQHQRLLDGAVYGFMLAFLLASLALWRYFRDPALTWFALMLATALLSLMSFNGHAAHYLWPTHPWWIEHSYVLFPALWLAACAGFARYFLRTHQRSARADAVPRTLLALALVSLGLGLAGWTIWAQHLNELVALAGGLAMALIAAVLWRRGDESARWYLLSSLVPFVTVLALLLVNWGALESQWVHDYSLEVGVLAQSVVLAIALGTRVGQVQQQNLALLSHSERLARSAATDALTGLVNRRGLAEISAGILQRPGTHALLLFDLDRFKPINDTLGHAAGDQVLQVLGRRLKQHSRERDVAARLGGDEFVLLIDQCPTRPELDAVIGRLRGELEAPIGLGAHTVQVSASVGVAIAPADGSELDVLLRAADWAMYAAKSRHQGVHFVADDLRSASLRDPVAPPPGVSAVG